MELFEFSNITQIVNRFKTVLKQKKVKQIDFSKNILKITARAFYKILNPKFFGDTKFFKKKLAIYKKIFEWTKENDEYDPIGNEPTI